MANLPHETPAKRPGLSRSLPADPRYEIVFQKKPSEPRAVSGLFAELKALGERGGSALGDAYALAASSLLNRLERLEDLNAERRFRQRPTAGPSRRRAASPSNPPRNPPAAK
jgi:hypothetical protein